MKRKIERKYFLKKIESRNKRLREKEIISRERERERERVGFHIVGLDFNYFGLENREPLFHRVGILRRSFFFLLIQFAVSFLRYCAIDPCNRHSSVLESVG